MSSRLKDGTFRGNHAFQACSVLQTDVLGALVSPPSRAGLPQISPYRRTSSRLTRFLTVFLGFFVGN